MFQPHFPTVLLALSAATAAFGQSPTRTAPQLPAAPAPAPFAGELMVPIHTSEADEVGGAYGVWAAGPDYKVGFHGGMRFVPVLGEGFAENAELAWTTSSIRIGADELCTGTAPRPRRAGDYRYEYRHGGIVEAYDVRVDGVEQTFVFAERPASDGDLVITGALSGNVSCGPQRARHAELLFHTADGRAVIGYGAATAVDANGATVPMTTSFADGLVQLRLPADALAAATFPLVVDPVITNRVIGVDNSVQDFDVYRDDEWAFSNVWIVFSRISSASDRDLVMRRFLDDWGGPGATVYADLQPTWSAVGGQIAGVGNNVGRTITAFTREYANSGSRRVRWHLHDKDDATLQTNYGTLLNVYDTNEWRPDIGGTSSNYGGDTALLVYQREHNGSFVFSNTPDSGVYGVRIDTSSTTNGQQGSAFEIAEHATFDYERPAVNQIAKGGNEWSWVVFLQSHENGPSSTWNISLRRVPSAGQMSNRYSMGISPTEHELSPRVEGYDGDYLLVWGERPVIFRKPGDVLCNSIVSRRITWPHNASVFTYPDPPRVLRSETTRRLSIGEVGYDFEWRSHWLVGYTDRHYGAQKLHAAKIGHDGLLVEDLVAYDVPGFEPLPPGVCYDAGSDRFTIGFGVDNGLGSNPVIGAHVTFDAVTPPTAYGVSCAGTAQTSFTGSQHVGSAYETMRLDAAAPNRPVVLGMSIGSNQYVSLDSIGMSNCFLHIDNSPGMLLAAPLMATNLQGRANLTVELPSELPPFTLRYQWFVLDPNANAAGITSTKAMRVEFAR